MRQRSLVLRRRRLVAMGGLAAGLTAAGVLGHLALQHLERSHGRVTTSHAALRSVERLRGAVNVAHSEHRGAFSTATADFINTRDSAIRAALGNLSDVRRLTRDNGLQQSRLDSLHSALDSLIASSRRMADLRSQSVDREALIAENARIEARFEHIAGVIERLEAEEERLLQARASVADAATHWARAILIISLVIAVIIALMALTPLFSALRRSQRMQKRLASSEARYRQLLEGAADAILVVVDGVCTEANVQAERLFKYPPGALGGRPVRELLESDHAGRMESINRLEPGDIVGGEYVARCGDGSRKTVDVSAIAFENDLMQVILRDITGRKEVERLKDEFVSVVSHELRTPLTALRGSVRLLRASSTRLAPDQQDRLLNMAETNADRLVRLVNDILDFERFNAGKASLDPTLTDVYDIAAEVIESLRPLAQQAHVVLALDGAPATAWADRSRVTQVLTNLIGNAIKFSPSDGVVVTTVTGGSDDVLIRVRDQGRGVPPEELESIFERFHQVDGSDARQKGGTGLGLAISRQIVTQHGGRIWAESVAGEGSTFSFTLPVGER